MELEILIMEPTIEMIPKTIHYCWFGRGQLPEIMQKCIQSWKKYLPDYKIIEWNEDNFDVNINLYVKQAYEAKKYAFVSDYARLHALYSYGGIYMDTDVEVLKPFDKFLSHEAFLGFESQTDILTAVMAAKKEHVMIKEFLDYYEGKSFINSENSYDTTTNVKVITNICLKYGLKRNNTHQIVNGLVLYPKHYFCPLSYGMSKSCFSDDTYAIHHYSGSWLTEKQRKRINSRFWRALRMIRDFLSKFLYKY